MKKNLLTIAAGIAGFSLTAGASDSLVSTEWVMENARTGDVRIAEVSVEPGVFDRGHVPGAVNLRWHTDLVDPVNRDIVSREGFEELMARNGITPDTTVVLYGDHNNWFAAWGVWVFNYYGHDDVKLMDGGRDKWERERRPMATRTEQPARTEYQVAEVRRELRAMLPDVVEAAEARGETASLVDIRSEDEYSGRVIAPDGVQELSVRAGHVPGAVNIPWNRAVADNGTFLSEDELRELYAGAGLDGSKPVITYCRIGERSSHTWFALKHILGYDDVRNYDGSWTEYGNAVGVPISNPAGTVWTGK